MLKRLRRRHGARWSLRRAARPAPGSSALTADVQAFLQVARQSFLQMQAAWDRADLPAMGVLATESLLEDLREQLALRGQAANHTEVLELQARVVALEELHEAFVASVEFSGLIRERLDDSAEPFRELWLLAKVKSAGLGWRLARVQSLT